MIVFPEKYRSFDQSVMPIGFPDSLHFFLRQFGTDLCAKDRPDKLVSKFQRENIDVPRLFWTYAGAATVISALYLEPGFPREDSYYESFRSPAPAAWRTEGHQGRWRRKID
jgi:hypothetical protein